MSFFCRVSRGSAFLFCALAADNPIGAAGAAGVVSSSSEAGTWGAAICSSMLRWWRRRSMDSTFSS
eukprot:scaffold1620_cov233-Pinguiococcus_pyrenoidosus.AAC.8